jgi:hypothetical protein
MNDVWAQIRSATGNPALRAVAGEPGGYNLMPHRDRRARVLWRRRALGAACATLGGIGMAAAVAAIDGRDERQLAARRHALEVQLAAHAEQLAEHGRLRTTLAREGDEVAAARRRATARDAFLALLDRLSGAAASGVALTELHRRDGETLLSGRVDDQRQLSVWLSDLRRAPGVASAQVVSLRRAALQDTPADERQDDAAAQMRARRFEFVARLTHGEPGAVASRVMAVRRAQDADALPVSVEGHS